MRHGWVPGLTTRSSTTGCSRRAGAGAVNASGVGTTRILVWRREMRRPLFGRHGRKVVALLCGWELVALFPGSPVPTISHTVEHHKVFGAVLLGLLAHHWFLELHEAVEAGLAP